jgi:selenocysteine lyase/cysteine desulfurase
MGYDNLSAPALDRWRAEFPVTEKLTYLNHAAVAPLSRRCATAMQRLAEDACLYGSLHYGDWLACYDGLRKSAASLVNATPDEIAIVKNTSEGISTVAMGLDWNTGDVVVAFREEFPSNFFPWQRLEKNGVKVKWLSIYDPLDLIDEAARGARLLAISYVNYLSGHRVDLDAIGEICRRHGVIFLVDAIQGLGAFPIDVRRSGIHALAADGHKWLLGPEGCGVLYIHQDLQDRVDPVEFGWTNVAGYNDYASRSLDLRQDAGRYECGTLNTIGCFGLQAAYDLVLEVGVDQIGPHVQALADAVARGVVEKGYETLSPRAGWTSRSDGMGWTGRVEVTRTSSTGAGIVSFRKEGHQSEVIVSALKKAGITAAPRQGWVRVSPHFYQTGADVERLLDVLP